MKDVWFSIGASKASRKLFVLGVNTNQENAIENAEDRGREVGCDATLVMLCDRTSRMEDEMRNWLADELDIIGSDATVIVRNFSQGILEMIDKARAEKASTP